MPNASDWTTIVPSYSGTPGPGSANRRDVVFAPGRGLFWIYQDASIQHHLESYDGTSWSHFWQLSPSPGESFSTRMVHDPIRDVLICVMAQRQTPFSYVGLNTYEIALGPSPSVVQTGNVTSFLSTTDDNGFDLVWDSTRHQAILVGITQDSQSGPEYYRTYTYDTGSGIWTKVAGEDVGTHPSSRNTPALAYDAARDKVVLAFGMDWTTFVRLNDVWEFDPAGSTWSSPSPTFSPAGRNSCEGVYDSTLGGVLVFGGITPSPELTVFDGAWLWNGTDWSQPLGYNEYSYTSGSWDSGPAPDVARYGFYMGYDSTRQRLILHHVWSGDSARSRFSVAPDPTDTKEWNPQEAFDGYLIAIQTRLGAHESQVYVRSNTGVYSELPGGPLTDYGFEAVQGFLDGKILACAGGLSHLYDVDAASWSTSDPGIFLMELHAPDPATELAWAAATAGDWGKWTGGGSWSNGVTGSLNDSNRVWAADSQEAWLLWLSFGSGGELWHTTNGGSNWTDRLAQLYSDTGLSDGYDLRDVFGFSSIEVYFVLQHNLYQAAEAALVKWDGANFSLSAAVVSYPGQACWGYNDGYSNIVLFAGSVDRGGAGISLYVHRWDGFSLSLAHSQDFISTSVIHGMGGLPDGSQIVLAGTFGFGAESVDGGLSWDAPDVSWPGISSINYVQDISYYSFTPSPPSPPARVTFSIEEGDGSGFVVAYDGYEFQPPYNAGRSALEVVSLGGGRNAYDFTVEKDGDWVLGSISIDATMDDYSGPLNREPEPNAYDVPRNTLVNFRVEDPE